jgi:hypothetical protein
MIEPVGIVVTGVRGGVGYGYEPHAAPGGLLEDNGTPRRSTASRRRVSI